MTKLLKNLSKRIYQHNVKGEIFQIMPGEKKEVPDDIANIWLKTKEIELVADMNEIEAKDKEISAKDKEIAELKKELKKAKGKKVSKEPVEEDGIEREPAKEEPIAE